MPYPSLNERPSRHNPFMTHQTSGLRPQITPKTPRQPYLRLPQSDLRLPPKPHGSLVRIRLPQKNHGSLVRISAAAPKCKPTALLLQVELTATKALHRAKEAAPQAQITPKTPRQPGAEFAAGPKCWGPNAPVSYTHLTLPTILRV